MTLEEDVNLNLNSIEEDVFHLNLNLNLRGEDALNLNLKEEDALNLKEEDADSFKH